MKIKLTNSELDPIIVIGEKRHLQGAQREILSFVFPASMGLEALDCIFSREACESITVTGSDGTETIYKGYTLRAEIKKAAVVVQPETPDAQAVIEDRITVSMAQRTYQESRLEELMALLDN